jgi:glycosyltransferase involved in cell wall biosynthesis
LKISLIIFGYNEHKSIKAVFENALDVIKTLSEDFEIIIVDDGSTDNTGIVLDEITEKHPNTIVVKHARNEGIGMALRSGYKTATKDYVCAIPADGQFNVSQLKILTPFESNTFYSFYRFDTRYGFYRRMLTWINRLFNQHLLGIYIRDVNWIKVYKKTQLETAKPVLTSSLIESEICAKLYKLGVMPIEIPSEYLERAYGLAKGGNWKTLKKAALETWSLFWIVYMFPDNTQ